MSKRKKFIKIMKNFTTDETHVFIALGSTKNMWREIHVGTQDECIEIAQTYVKLGYEQVF